ncbi:galactitol-1-phosphate 5-dehydrogenase [Lactobacillus sp. ESL0791]|uniref:galactitol-1-phosphate 5-dehydrogenase n=1 Tax=Lactobacillus sp. ESL0791 TaxID=2983234 RepID=UPI0023F9993B|nr:galactitol-1-phosphate 5-dehydrogenase [Lactobacillus sp. ESL0791]MDF7639462.1 galactitol-1-phosphate 5-dehydrogenase [Lactobacillus sp. ESL0791]
MKAVALTKIGKLEMIEKEKPQPKEGEVLVQIKAAGICGSDIPRVFVNGAYHFPTVLGHEFSGKIVETGKNVDSKMLGSRVAVFPLLPCHKCKYCVAGHFVQCENYHYFGSRNDGAFEEYLAVPTFNLLPISDNISYEEAAMIEPATVAQHAIQKAHLRLGDNVVVYGAGPIGMMAARWAKINGANEVILFDIDKEKIALAKSLGFDHILYNRGNENSAAIQEIFNGELADVAVEATGNTHSFNDCVNSIRKFGKVIMLGNPHSEMTLDQSVYDQCMRKEGEILSVYNSVFKGYPIDEWKVTERAVSSGRLKINDLITQKVSIDNLIELFETIHDHKEVSCKAMMVNK